MQFDEITRKALEDNSFTTSQIRIEKWGKVQYDKIFTRDKEITNPMFDIASITKIFTTTAILRLITLKKLQIVTSIKEILPTFPSSLQHITIDKLLTHSSGLLAWYPFYTQAEKPFEDLLSELINSNPITPGMVYSDINFMILGKIIESVTSFPLDNAMEELVFKPLNLKHTAYNPPKDRCIPTEWGNKIEEAMVHERKLSFKGFRPTDTDIVGECNDGNCFYYFHGIAGHAGLFSTVADLHILMNLYLYNSDEFLSESLVQEAISNKGQDRGYGFQLGDNYPHGGVGHTGFTGTYIYVNPSRGYTISVLTNRLHVPSPRNIQVYRNAIVNEAIATF